MVKNIVFRAVILAASLAVPAYAAESHPKHIEVQQRHHLPAQVGTASWYGRWHAGRKTANGERFNPMAMTGAHRTLPLGSLVQVTNVETGQKVDLQVNDRGPYVRGRILDVSQRAAQQLGFEGRGVATVRLEVVRLGEPEQG